MNVKDICFNKQSIKNSESDYDIFNSAMASVLIYCIYKSVVDKANQQWGYT
jgi:hypothetical protein